MFLEKLYKIHIISLIKEKILPDSIHGFKGTFGKKRIRIFFVYGMLQKGFAATPPATPP